MHDATPVQQFLVDEGIINLSAELPDRHIKPHLIECLKDWCFEQNIANKRRNGAWRENLDAKLSEHGAHMCRNLQIAALVLRDVETRLEAQPDLLLRLLDWLCRQIAQQAEDELAAARLRLRAARLRTTLEQDWPPAGQTASDAGNAEIEQMQIARLERDVEELERQGVPRAIIRLEALLRQGHSGWQAGVDPPGLVERVSQEERREYKAATADGDVAAQHLQAAWRAAWGIDEDGQRAFDEAVKALEAAFRPVAAPKDPGATLGKIAHYLDVKPDKWRARLVDARPPSSGGKGDGAGVQTLADLLRAIVAANRRHATDGARSQNSLDDGRDAVSLAVALVAMQRRGLIQAR